jgi:hypothetical protein
MAAEVARCDERGARAVIVVQLAEVFDCPAQQRLPTGAQTDNGD